MTDHTIDPPPVHTASSAIRLEEVVSRLRPCAPDRRRAQRVAAPFLLKLTPVHGRDGSLVAPPVTVVGKDLSVRAVGFYHQQPLPHKHVRLELDEPGLGQIVMDVELTWCRFSKLCWYESGGKVLNLWRGADQVSQAG